MHLMRCKIFRCLKDATCVGSISLPVYIFCDIYITKIIQRRGNLSLSLFLSLSLSRNSEIIRVNANYMSYTRVNCTIFLR